MVGFGPKQAWLAVRDREPAVIAEALGLRELGDVSWRAGIDLAYVTDDRVVITPLLPGAADRTWSLVVGRWLLTNSSTVDVAALSARLATEVQFFSSYRVGERHEWRRAVGGELLRAFAFVGETGEVSRWEGTPDPVELAIGLTVADDPTLLVGEGDVMRVAGAWSIDPTSIAELPAPGPMLAASA